METIENSANTIKMLLQANSNLLVITSPTTRACGSADIIATTLQYRGKIKIEPEIQGAVVKNEKEGMALFKEYVSIGGIIALDRAYGVDSRYEKSPNIIEPRSEIRKRFFRYFSKIVKHLLVRELPPLHLICVSHYETLYHLVEQLFNLDYRKDKTLGHGEIIEVVIYDIGFSEEKIVEIEITFRKQTKYKKFFDFEEQKIR